MLPSSYMGKIVIPLCSLVCLGHGWQLKGNSLSRKREPPMARGTRLLGSESESNVWDLAELMLELRPNMYSRSASPTSTSFRSDMSGPTMLGGANLLAGVDQSVQAYEWMANLAAPAALVSGAALGSLYQLQADVPENKSEEKAWVSFARKLGAILFLTAFAFEIACVFVTTVTGTLMLGKGVSNPVAPTAMRMLRRELEFEYLASRVFFFQGLLNWLFGVAVHLAIPRPGSNKAMEALQRSHAWGIGALLTYMVAYYNKHISFYANYGAMLVRLLFLAFHRLYADQFRILPVIALIPLFLTLKNAWQSFSFGSEKEKLAEEAA